MRLIDADALRDVYLRYSEAPHLDLKCDIAQGMRMAVSTCIELLDNRRTVDAVEVVRCKDCRHCEIVDETQRYFCRRPLGTIGYVPVQPDDYCSYGQDRR